MKVDGNGRVVMFLFHSDSQKTHSHLIIDLHGAGTHFSALVCPLPFVLSLSRLVLVVWDVLVVLVV